MFKLNKFLIKNIIYITLIIIIAIVATHHIYYKFKNLRKVDYSSDTLEIVFNEKNGNKISLLKAVPVTDSVGLSSTAYTLSITSNLTEKAHYKLKVVDDIEKIAEDNCQDNTIPKEYIRISVKEDNEKVQIYSLNELVDNTIIDSDIEALGTKEYTIHVWVTTNEDVNINTNLHYHGIIKVEEDKYGN